MTFRFKLGGCLLALALSAGLTLPAAAQRVRSSFPQQQAFHPQEVKEQRRPPQRNDKPKPPKPPAQRPANPVRNFPAQNKPQNAPRPNVNPSRPPANGNPGGNPNRPPNTNGPQMNPRRFQDLSKEDKQRVLQNQQKFNRLPPQKQQEMKEAARNWQKMTPEQQSHIKNDVLPKWKQLPPERQRAIQQRLGVLKNMPESARNQHLDDPNFTRGMSEEDKATLRDLSHLHVGGAPDPPQE